MHVIYNLQIAQASFIHNLQELAYLNSFCLDLNFGYKGIENIIQNKAEFQQIIQILMNKNHFDIQVVCAKKILRLEACLLDIRQAEAIMEELPEDLTQKIWIETIESKQSNKNSKTKAINKGIYKRSFRKTLESIKTMQQKMLIQIKEKLNQAQDGSQQRKQEKMKEVLKEFLKGFTAPKSELSI